MTTYKILGNNAPVKNKPTFFASTIGHLKKGTKIKVTSINGIWANFKFKNKSAYILTFYLKKVEIITTGSIKIRYLNVDTNEEIAPYVTHNSLELKSYSYTAPALDNYTVVEPSTISVTLSSSNPNQEIKFYYKENTVYGSVTIKYIDKNTQTTLAESRIYSNLELGSYSYHSIDIEGYRVLGESTKSITLTKNSHDATIVFEYTQIFGKVTVKYIDVDTKVEITEPDVHTDLTIGEYTYSAKSISGYVLVSNDIQMVTLTYDNYVQVLVFEYKKYDSEDSIYTIDLEKYNISNDNTNAADTTKGINQALVDAKSVGYKRVQLPKGHYAIDTDLNLSSDKNGGYGIKMLSNMELILNGCTLEMLPCEDPAYSILAIWSCKNSKVTGGTILGDRETHNYGMRINENIDMFESGDLDSNTGEIKTDDTKVRTKDFISVYKDWFTKEEESLPTNFYIIPLWNTTMNTVDGGQRYIYCYDKNNNYLGMALGDNGYIEKATLLNNTAKIKISIKGEKRLDIVLAMTKRSIYYTYEFGCGLTIGDSDSIEINGTTIKNCIGDCIGTQAPRLNNPVNNLSIIGCTLENSRRQGISFVATGENYLIKDCNIGHINGVDPQFGIDFEHYDYVRNVIIDNCKFYNNKNGDIDNYNGNDIEIKNSIFSSYIVSIYGWNMSIHDNIFNGELSNKPPLVLDTNKTDEDGVYFSIYNNTFSNYTKFGGNTSYLLNSYFNYNKIYNCENFTITCKSHSNNFFNSTIIYDNKINNGININDSQYENSTVTSVNYDNSSSNFYDCVLTNSSLGGRGNIYINNCLFNTTTKSIIDGWAPDSSLITYNKCTFNSTFNTNIQLLGSSLNTNCIFNNCNFNISRFTLSLSYGTLTFNTCNFVFNNINTSQNSINLNETGYGFDRCPWYFNNCSFESNYPINIYGDNVNNPIITGPVTVI